jgi:membrane protein YqaA with SNARE-associated domain
MVKSGFKRHIDTNALAASTLVPFGDPAYVYSKGHRDIKSLLRALIVPAAGSAAGAMLTAIPAATAGTRLAPKLISKMPGLAKMVEENPAVIKFMSSQAKTPEQRKMVLGAMMGSTLGVAPGMLAGDYLGSRHTAKKLNENVLSDRIKKLIG